PEAGATADITLQGTGELVGDVHQLGLRRGRVTMAGTIAQPDGGADPIPFPSTLVVSIDQPEGG
ncbi:MAG TPA: hypothetical protein VD926_12610, partial [Acidimicrobiales bacterium]|nr:hypothetical protein [Acidimicrobiales bacterium]